MSAQDGRGDNFRTVMACALQAGMPAECFEAITVALERARVVQVLDSWAEKGRRFVPTPSPREHGRWGVIIGERDFTGATPDVARAKAAAAIEAGEV